MPIRSCSSDVELAALLNNTGRNEEEAYRDWGMIAKYRIGCELRRRRRMVEMGGACGSSRNCAME